MLRLVSRMSIPENIPPGKAAFNITVKPREADIIQPYKKGSYTGGPKHSRSLHSGFFTFAQTKKY
jgi:hypothetical protein